MPKINVNITNVAAMSNRIKGVRFNKVQDVRTNVINVRNTLDSRVAEYRLRGMDNIFNRLTWVHSSIYNAETDLRIIEDILERDTDRPIQVTLILNKEELKKLLELKKELDKQKEV